MAQYTITHTCGHTETVQLYGPGRERDRKAEWMTNNICPECFKAEQAAKRQAENEAAAAQNTAESLPELLGSPKQVAWAETLRRKALDQIANGELLSEASVKEAMEGAADDPARLARLKRAQELIKGFVGELRRQDSAKWWIENQRDDWEWWLIGQVNAQLRREEMGRE